MDSKTAIHYATRLHETTALYKTLKGGGASEYFSQVFSPGSRILDIGTGSGRDLNLLLTTGYDAWGVDALPEMVDAAVREYPSLASRMAPGEIPSDSIFFGGAFDGILCSALLMHIPDAQAFDALFTIRNNLKPGGALLISVPHERPSVGADSRLPDGRLFVLRSQYYYDLLLERLGFIKTNSWTQADSLGREGISWSVAAYRLEEAIGARAIDKIEGIINRDKKTATYKLALFRALADIAVSEYNTAVWLSDGSVGIPLASIARKWLYYYWPLFEHEEFVPQINGESPGCGKPVKFRKSLSKLISEYRPRGGLSSFHAQFSSVEGRHPAGGGIAHVIKEISETIVKGPVTYSGGSLEDGTVFIYDASRRLVLVPFGIWKELSLLGHWITDALVLRWGELTSRMSGNEIPPSIVIDLLLRGPVSERDMNAVRGIFAGMPSLECVWSGKALAAGFAIDHMIPFALWRNNDLWNLLPSHPKVNSTKSDRLPSRRLLKSRRDAIINYWKVSIEKLPSRFAGEYTRIAGVPFNENWESTLFAVISDAVEITALQRGAERFDGA